MQSPLINPKTVDDSTFGPLSIRTRKGRWGLDQGGVIDTVKKKDREEEKNLW